ncbi:S8 family serine peptidase [Fodinibius halophilus]|uniref:S8 family serine peptidase n=1 Tax=Fodinibius halophilus TaxID=1736908 RepID=A0A6M1TEE5_9BACT|nr:S8 family serine peptidase [Fodinibius halophilus]NGP89144.1 S8 family serine peptidase [Fodinibius halophilus]
MLKKLFYLLALLLFFSFQSYGQQPNFFSDRLIIKYESEQKLTQIRAKNRNQPKRAVQKVLADHGMRRTKPLLNNQIRQALKRESLASAKEVLRIHEVYFNKKISPLVLAEKISRMPGVAYAEPKFIRQMHYEPNDPQLGKYINTHNFKKAWDLSQGSREVIIAINDGGVGYTHTELDANLWVNQDEIPPTLQPQVDQNNDNTITSTEIDTYLNQNGDDYNGDGEIDLQDVFGSGSPFIDNLDTDQNSYTDDIFGWDFWESGTSNIEQDNNPFHNGTDHGTHVAGIAAAETDNNAGIAGAAFTATYMPVKTGGIPDDPSTPNTDESNSIGFGYEGIIYAAQNGADIINCSWGGSGSSQAERDIIDLATEMGSLVVGASGNDGSQQVGYPAAYDNVLGVGSVEPNNSVANYSNVGYKLDVLSTGTDILSTSYNQTLVTKTGTSMATPVVSGLAALVKSFYPNWSAERLSLQIRSSSTFIDNSNSLDLQNKLGHGSINAFKALNIDYPGIKVISYQFVDNNGEKLTLGEPGTVKMKLTNLGAPASSLNLTLNSLNKEGVEISNNPQQLGSISNGDTLDVTLPISLSQNFDLNQTPTLKLNFVDSNQGYEDFSILEYENLLFDIIAVNNVKTSLAADGSIGFTNPLAGSGGIGFIPRSPDGTGGYQEGDNLLFEGGLILEIDGEIIDATRAENGLSRDFIPQQVFIPKNTSDGAKGTARFITDPDSVEHAIIDLETYSFDEPTLSNVIFLKYSIQNPSTFARLKNIYVGLFNDWDIGDSGNNNIRYNKSDSLLYLSGASNLPTTPTVAVAHLGPISSVLGIDNTIDGRQDSVTFGLYDGFTDNEKSIALKAGEARTEVSETDVSAVTASGPYTINPGAEITVGFIYAFGNTTSELRNQIAEARSLNLFEVSSTGTAIADKTPTQTNLFQNYPNPFQEETNIHFDLAQPSSVQLIVYDVLGRKVRTLLSEQMEAGPHFVTFDPKNLSSGTYFIYLNTNSETQTVPVTYIK